MTERPSLGEQIAGIAGLALFLTMFLFAWYGIDVPGVNGFDAFDAFSDWFDIILMLAAISGMCLALFGSGTLRVPVSLSVVTTVLGGLAAIITLIYIISPPGIPTFGEAAPEIDLNREFGVWLGLIETIALAVGGYMTMQEEGVSFGSAADRLSSRQGGPNTGWHEHQHQPPAQPQPPQPQQPYQQPPAPPQQPYPEQPPAPEGGQYQPPPPPQQPPPGA